jgi:ABC-type lipoprotein release transport system permease subunit
LTALALGLGLALLLVSLAVLDGVQEEIITNDVKLGPGHTVVQAKGYQESRSQDLLLPAWVVSTTQEFLHDGDLRHSVQGVSPRLLASGLLSSTAGAFGVSIQGVIPETERLTSLIAQRVVEGTYLRDGRSPGLVIGTELARRLKVKIGSKVVLMAQAVRPSHSEAGNGAGGDIQSALFRVTGIFRTGRQAIDTRVIHLPLSAAQSLLGAPDQVTQVAILLGREGDSPLVARRLQEQLGAAQAEVLTWQESMAELAQIFRLQDAFRYVITVILLIMVELGILNTILMSVLERHHEFGVCAALGLRPARFVGLILCESLVLTTMSLALGLALGLGAHYYFATSGLDLRWFFADSLFTDRTVFNPVVYSRLSPGRVAWAVGVVLVLVAVMSVYPAFKAARTKLPDALRVF